MYKKSLLSCTATAAIILFNIQFSVHAESLTAGKGEVKQESGKEYETIQTTQDGKITGTDLKITGEKEESSPDTPVVKAADKSVITLTGNKTQIGGENSKIFIGLEATNNAVIDMNGGFITVQESGAIFKSQKDNKLANVTISSSGKDGKPLQNGISADNGKVILENVTVTHADYGINAENNSTIAVKGGNFTAEQVGVSARSESTITLDNVTVTSKKVGIQSLSESSKIVMTGGSVTGEENALFAYNEGHIKTKDVTLKTGNKGYGAFAQEDSIIELSGNTKIENALIGLKAETGGKITSENLAINGLKKQDPNSEDVREGISAESKSEVILKGETTIKNVDSGLAANGGSKIVSGNLTVIGDKATGMSVGAQANESDSTIELNGKTVIKDVSVGLFASEGGTINMSGSNSSGNGKQNTIEAKKIALFALNNGSINLKNTSITAELAGIQLLSFFKNDPDDRQKSKGNEIILDNIDLHVDNGTAIFAGAVAPTEQKNQKNPDNEKPTADSLIGTVNLKNSQIYADVLLGNNFGRDKELLKESKQERKVEFLSNGTFTLNADHSTLEGRAEIAENRNVRFDLKNGTIWTLKNSAKEKDDDGKLLDIAQRSRSDISELHLDNSSIVFNGPTEDHYHTLHIGSGKPDSKAVYNATGDAKTYFNIAWSDGAAIADQKTDRLLIHGDVSGSTMVYIKSDTGDKESVINASDPSNVSSISLIQVSGKANEDSFKLANGYTTIGGSPYKYTLTAYGPGAKHGPANIEQSLFEDKDENFWDFRLHKSFTTPDSGEHAVVPQMASYLVMPTALFYSGLTDMVQQNALLANIRTSSLENEQEKKNGFFLYSYGSTGTLSSESAPHQYGYSGANIRSAALQGGATLSAIEGQNTSTYLGIVGTYNQLSFTPKDMQDAGKSTLDKWSLTAYSSVQHDNGLYLDTLLSYGILKGDITNGIIGKTAELKNAKMWNISTTIGKQFATSIEGLTFEPQAQVAYQHLMLDTLIDIDNFKVDMNNPHQWVVRVGGRVTKTFVTAENGRSISISGKLNAIKTFDDDKAIYIDKNYQLESMGTTLEGGLGINAQLSQNISLHGDISYQQKLQKTGISGANFSGGIRYKF